MKTTINKTGCVWEWSISENGEHLRGGYSKTKGDAENDAAIVRESLEIDAARRDGRIAKGDEIKIKPEWMDAGDENFRFIAAETQLPGMLSIRARALHASGEVCIGVQSIYLNMIERP